MCRERRAAALRGALCTLFTSGAFAFVPDVPPGFRVTQVVTGLEPHPGDILIRRDGVTVYIPIVTSLALSVILTLVVSLLVHRR